jgi:hypothetical protein
MVPCLNTRLRVWREAYATDVWISKDRSLHLEETAAAVLGMEIWSEGAFVLSDSCANPFAQRKEEHRLVEADLVDISVLFFVYRRIEGERGREGE